MKQGHNIKDSKTKTNDTVETHEAKVVFWKMTEIVYILKNESLNAHQHFQYY